MLHQQQAATSGVVNDLGQLDIAVGAITINTTSKLTYSDALLFRSLLKRIFPECEQKTMEDAELEARLTGVAAKKKLALYPDLVRKCTELLEQMKHRIGVVISGPPASGKTLEISQLWKLLAGTKSFGNKDVICLLYTSPSPRDRG